MVFGSKQVQGALPIGDLEPAGLQELPAHVPTGGQREWGLKGIEYARDEGERLGGGLERHVILQLVKLKFHQNAETEQPRQCVAEIDAAARFGDGASRLEYRRAGGERAQ